MDLLDLKGRSAENEQALLSMPDFCNQFHIRDDWLILATADMSLPYTDYIELLDCSFQDVCLGSGVTFDIDRKKNSPCCS